LKEAIEGVGYSCEKAVTALAEIFGAAFSSAIQESCQNQTSATCTRIDKTSLSEVLEGAAAPLSAVGFKFLEGLSGHGLALVRQEDLAGLAAQSLPDSEKAEMDTDAAWKFWDPIFTRAMEEVGAQVAALEGTAVKGDTPRLLASEADPESLSESISAFENAISMTFDLSVESVLDTEFWLLVHPDILTSLEALLSRAEPVPAVAPDGAVESKWNMDLILDVELGVTVAFGGTEMPLRDVLKLGVGSVVELEKGVNDPVTIIVNEKPIARGEVVMVDGNYGVRILEVESTAERIRSLG
jgi:flagellar motor switch protein FliN